MATSTAVGATLETPDTTVRARVQDLSVTFQRRGVPLNALRGVSLDVQPGEVLALVGESGSGKSVMGLALLGLLAGETPPMISGRAEVCGIDMVAASRAERRRVRKAHLGAVFQDPMTSLDPTMRVGRQVTEATGDADEALTAARSRRCARPGPADEGVSARTVRRPAAARDDRDGGGRQARTWSSPTNRRPPSTSPCRRRCSALLRDLCNELGTSFIVVTHDIGVASQIADRVAVLYGGRLAELGTMDEVLRAPSHPYTVGLLNSRLDLDLPLGRAIPRPAGSAAGSARAPERLRLRAALPGGDRAVLRRPA